MARDLTSYLYRLALGSTLSLAGLAAFAGEEPRAAQEAHINVQDTDGYAPEPTGARGVSPTRRARPRD